MNRVVVVEDETMARKGIILTIDWSALGCVIVGKLPMEKRERHWWSAFRRILW